MPGDDRSDRPAEDTRLHRRVAELVAGVCDGDLSAEEAAAAPSLTVAGIGSLDSVRIVDALEREFGVTLPDDPAGLDSVAGLAGQLQRLGVTASGEGP